MAKELSWHDAMELVLRKADGPLHYTEIAEQVVAQALKKVVGATPADTVAAILSTSIKGGDSPFVRLGKGEYTLRVVLDKKSEDTSSLVVADEITAEAGALRAFGMFWRRDSVVWSGRQPTLLGRQGLGASSVDFGAQVGVYLLHDRERVIYVGRATDTMVSRLKAHTTDRLGGRWDRFSWFGLRPVKEDASLGEPTAAWDHLVVIETLEALLIESLEPPLNRRRGDNFSGVEYIQVEDPEIDRLKKKQLLDRLASSL
jgi:hypothetical protein